MDNKISLAGDLGSGKSTVSAILTERLGAKYYSTGAIVRKIAESRNMTVVELNKYMETHPEIDHEIDAGIAALSEAPESLIIDSRMAWHFTKGTFKVYLSTDIETSAYRIMSANRQGEQAASFEETIANTRARRDSEKKRYLEQYGVNIKDLTNYTLIVDTTVATPTEVADCIERGFRLWQADKSYSEACISPERLNFPDIEPDTELVARLSCMLDRGEAIPTPEVVEADGEFYLVSGLESAMAYSFSMSTYIYARLISGSVPEGEFVKMKNSL